MGVASSAPSYLGSGFETDRGVATAITDFLAVKANTFGVAFDKMEGDVFVPDRFTKRLLALLKAKLAGQLTWSLYPNAGQQFALAALGKEVFMAALAADATSSLATTANGLTTLTAANPGSLTYTEGAFIKYGAPPNQELIRIVSVAGNGAPHTQLMVKALNPGTSLAIGQVLQQVQQDRFMLKDFTDMNPFENPTLTMERNVGMAYAWQMPGCVTLSLNVKGSKADVEAMCNIVGTVKPTKLDTGAFTTYAPTQQEEEDLTKPYNVKSGYVVVQSDLGGGSFQQKLVTLEDWEFDLKSNEIDKAFWNESDFLDVYLGTIGATIKYKYSNAANRLSEYEDYLIRRDAPTVPFELTLVSNRGPASAPAWRGWGLHVPAMKFMNASDPVNFQDTRVVPVEATVTKAYGKEVVSIFVVSDRGSAYLA